MRILLVLLIGCTQPAPPPPPPVVAKPSPSPVVLVKPSPFPLPPPSDPGARLKAPAEPKLEEKLPNPALEWLVVGKPAPGTQLRRPAVLGELDANWRRIHDLVRVYGWHGDRAVLLSADDAESYDQIACSMMLVTAVGDDDLRVAGAELLAALRDDVSARLKRAGAVEILVPVTPEEGTQTARKLQALFMANGTEVQLKLLAPGVQSFDGKQLLDVLVSLGLEPASDGSVEFGGFGVKTRSPPGWFDTRALSEGRMKPNNLIFEMYVPHARNPVATFDLMARAHAYAAKRLGGQSEIIVENFGFPKKTDLKSARKRVAEVAAALQKAGFPAGTPTTNQLFAVP